MRKSLIILIICMMVFSSFAFADDVNKKSEKKREECPVCGMYIHQYERTAATLIYKNGKTVYTCGIACLLRILEDKGADAFSSITVRDFNTGKELDAREASYSIGSRVIPDMIPNIIAFGSKDAADDFAKAESGEVVDFNRAMQIISPRGMTNPFRMQPAVTSPAGAFGVGGGFSYGRKDSIMLGPYSQDPGDFIRSRATTQARAPKFMETYGESLFFNYSFTDRFTALFNVPFFEKYSSRYNNDIATSTITEVNTNKKGLGDLDLKLRYNLWRSTYYDKWFTIALGTTIPTGKFETALIDSPGLQLGTGAPSLTGGPLFSYNWRDFWIHSSATYSVRFSNDQGYSFGDEFAGALALHYTPNYNFMFGIESDISYARRNENAGASVGNSGGTRVNLTFVGDWRFLNALGGNFTLRGSFGLPIYENLNQRTVGTMQQTQLGSGFFGNASLSYATRFPFFKVK